MTVKYSTAYGSYIFHCLYGCLESGFADEQSARDAFIAHKC